MGHLTPAVKRSMQLLLEDAGIRYRFIDEDGSICCGRPLMLAGEVESARRLMEKNVALFKATGARVLVTSCPICYKVFREDYPLTMEVMHHTAFLNQLVKEGRLRIEKSAEKLVYHDPCDLGRGSGEYRAPRELLAATGELLEPHYTERYSLCCGGALGNFQLNYDTREKITNDALRVLLAPRPDKLITACPLCKKTFAKSSTAPVLDIAEWLASSLTRQE